MPYLLKSGKGMKKALFIIILSVLAFQPVISLAIGTNHRFTGQELDVESGLYNYNAREYNPSIGRFNQPDPLLNNLADPQKLKESTGQELQKFLENPQNLNSYSYVKGNPVKYVDPEGEFNFETNQAESGDTLYGVFGNNWQEVANYNNLDNPNLIYPGQHINIPEFVQKNLWQNIADIATGFIPGFSDVRDVIESLTKEDLITGRDLTPGEESITVPAVFLAGVISGKELRGIKNIDTFLKDLKPVAKIKFEGNFNIGLTRKSSGKQIIHIGNNMENSVKGWHIGIGRVHIFLNPIKQIKHLFKSQNTPAF